MKISTKGRYALRLMADLAVNNRGGYTTLKEISERQQISIKYLEQIAALLSHAGLLKSYRGASGGYRLKKHPRDYTVGDILRVTEGSLAPVACLDDGASCPRRAECPTLAFWEGLYATVNDYVDSVTLEDLARPLP